MLNRKQESSTESLARTLVPPVCLAVGISVSSKWLSEEGVMVLPLQT